MVFTGFLVFAETAVKGETAEIIQIENIAIFQNSLYAFQYHAEIFVCISFGNVVLESQIFYKGFGIQRIP